MHELYREVGWKEGGRPVGIGVRAGVRVRVRGRGRVWRRKGGGRRGSIV